MKKLKKLIIVTSSVVGGVIALSGGAIGVMAATSYKCDEIASSLLEDSQIKTINKNIYIESPNKSDVGIVFYTGARVGPESYVPLCKQISEYNINVFILKMPANFAFFAPNKANKVIENEQNISKWYVAGHSLGGTMASSFASNNSSKIEGLILLGSYPYKEYPLKKTLTVYGTLDNLATKYVTYDTNVIKIEGGNHCYFGNYGQQTGDSIATITREEQQNITSEAIKNFILR